MDIGCFQKESSFKQVTVQAPNTVKSRVKAGKAAQWVNHLAYWHEDLNLDAQQI